ncbi:hypothetical protein DPEC_G00294170 [Dallia pectoralis]|uniref:Uncharacterized protein n=1 Tax=Dallia pectoralis TaxID=75939 RepID=A0ACC2FIP7_DALPE|nr:hypothetical protein DPEC_G00294170 [Dallia pectoralis]
MFKSKRKCFSSCDKLALQWYKHITDEERTQSFSCLIYFSCFRESIYTVYVVPAPVPVTPSRTRLVGPAPPTKAQLD